MTIGARQQSYNTNLASTCLSHVCPAKVHSPSVVMAPARNLAGQVARQWQSYSRCVATMTRTAANSTNQQAPQQFENLSSKGLSAAEGRQMLVDSTPLESFKMTGVSFEGRQDLVSRLKPGDTATASSWVLTAPSGLATMRDCKLLASNYSCYTVSRLQVTCRSSCHDGQGASQHIRSQCNSRADIKWTDTRLCPQGAYSPVSSRHHIRTRVLNGPCKLCRTLGSLSESSAFLQTSSIHTDLRTCHTALLGEFAAAPYTPRHLSHSRSICCCTT